MLLTSYLTYKHTSQGARSHLHTKVIPPITFTVAMSRFTVEAQAHTLLCFFIYIKAHLGSSHKCQVLCRTLWILTFSNSKMHFSSRCYQPWWCAVHRLEIATAVFILLIFFVVLVQCVLWIQNRNFVTVSSFLSSIFPQRPSHTQC